MTRLKTIVVDDEPSILHAFRRVFSDTDITVLAAENASYGSQLAREQEPDVVILDVNLPDMSGLDLFDRIRAIDSKIPVIFITYKCVFFLSYNKGWKKD